jgi:hypothetical protein
MNTDYTCMTCGTAITEEEEMFLGECPDCINAACTCDCGAVMTEEESLYIGECADCINKA